MTSLFVSVSVAFLAIHVIAKKIIDYFGLDDVEGNDDDDPYPCMGLT